MFEGIEFTDRYGGRTPSWLRACFQCEAMGTHPTQTPTNDTAVPDDMDGWWFQQCDKCGGSARCSWIVTAGRVPRWLVRGIPFVYRYGIRREFYPEGGRWKSLKIAVGSAYGADLGLWKP